MQHYVSGLMQLAHFYINHQTYFDPFLNQINLVSERDINIFNKYACQILQKL